jgi:UDP-N-acetylglucosamine 2-epimerase (non-hydrolysing)
VIIPFDLVLVLADVTFTIAFAIVAKKLNIRVAHVEAEIRSLVLTMIEEINRMVTDSIANLSISKTKNIFVKKKFK